MFGMMRRLRSRDYGSFVPVCVYSGAIARTLVPFALPGALGHMPKHIGIAAVTFEGAALCYRMICAEAGSVMGEYQHPEITLHAFPFADHMAFISKGDWEGVAGLLLKSAEKLARAGADFAICPANTTHEAFKFMESRSSGLDETSGASSFGRGTSRELIIYERFRGK
jgi:hypothetical protein